MFNCYLKRELSISETYLHHLQVWADIIIVVARWIAVQTVAVQYSFIG